MRRKRIIVLLLVGRWGLWYDENKGWPKAVFSASSRAEEDFTGCVGRNRLLKIQG
jgi:hypothetical protein